MVVGGSWFVRYTLDSVHRVTTVVPSGIPDRGSDNEVAFVPKHGTYGGVSRSVFWLVILHRSLRPGDLLRYYCTPEGRDSGFDSRRERGLGTGVEVRTLGPWGEATASREGT